MSNSLSAGPSVTKPYSNAELSEQLKKQRIAYASLEEKWTKAKQLLIEVNEQNKMLRGDLGKKTEQLKKLFDEYQTQKSTVAELESERDAHVERLKEQQQNIRKVSYK